MMRTTVFTCSIYPDLTRVWYHFVRRHLDPTATTTVIYDCDSRLRPQHFPGARIVRHSNVDHGRKIDHCVREQVKTPLLFLSDDDTFVLSDRAEPMATEALLAEERAAAFSFKPHDLLDLAHHLEPAQRADAITTVESHHQHLHHLIEAA